MTTYAIREYSWKTQESDARTLYEFESARDFMVYANIKARTHGSVDIKYDKETDTTYMEE